MVFAWSEICSDIKHVITKSHDLEAGVRFVITRIARHEVQLQLSRADAYKQR
jgi:hypothetical protein